jgi:hypothetical protein
MRLGSSIGPSPSSLARISANGGGDFEIRVSN